MLLCFAGVVGVRSALKGDLALVPSLEILLLAANASSAIFVILRIFGVRFESISSKDSSFLLFLCSEDGDSMGEEMDEHRFLHLNSEGYFVGVANDSYLFSF